MFPNLDKLIKVCSASIEKLLPLVIIKIFVPFPLCSMNMPTMRGFVLFKVQGNEKS